VIGLANNTYNMKYIYHHLGLGDHIICNGLVRSLIRENETYTMFVKGHNKKTVEFMYRDLKNLNFMVANDYDVKRFFNQNNISESDKIIAGFTWISGSKSFDESFYLQNDVPISKRWEKFYVNRDLSKEKELFYKFDVVEGNYVFIHDDSTRNYNINEDLIINKNLKIVRPVLGLTENVFDYCYLMQNSLESHFIDSSFRLIFDSLKLRNTNIFYHIKMKGGVLRNDDPYFDSRHSFLNFTIFE
jgi:hypothetical protein